MSVQGGRSSQGRGRPKKSPAQKAMDAGRAREAIVRAAAAVVERDGAQGLSVESVLGAARISRRTFYRYFKSKEDLLVGLFSASSSELIARTQAALGGTDALDAVRACLDTYLDFHADAGELLLVLTEEAIRSDSKLHPLRASFQQSLIALLDHAVGARSGRRIEPFVFVALIGAVEAVSLQLLRGDSSASALARAKAATHGILEATLATEAGLSRLPEAPA